MPEQVDESGRAVANVKGLEPTTTYSATIAARTDHGTYGPALISASLFKTLASAPDKPTVTKTTVTTTGNIVVSNAGFIFVHLARHPHFNNVTRRPGYSWGPSRFLPVSIERMSFFKGLFS